ncbi:Lrp/AsnC family transcriptional regulator [Synergistaceae bacterium OttesenSCG-928-D05]|nr:Lrp/AsnC family transcriptional regulator [Synergistaceae bacterium OttesenSCG-928-D05]
MAKREVTPMDETGWKILEELQKNARISFKQLAEKVNLSPTATIERVKRMEEEGIIVDYRATVDPRKVGYSFSALLNFQTNYGNPDPVIGELIKDIPEVISSWSITGSNDFLMEIQVPTLEFLQELLVLLSKHGKITTSVVLPDSTKKGLIHAPRKSIENEA